MASPSSPTSRSIKIVFISPFLFRYMRGIERFTVELANALAREGVEIHLITWREKNVWPWGELHQKVRLHALALPRYFQAFWAGLLYIPLLMQLKPDFVFLVFTWCGEEITFRFLPHFKRKIIFGLHYPAEQVPHRYRTLQKSCIPKAASQIVAVSGYVAEGARKSLGREVIVIPTGVDLTKFHPEANKIQVRAKLTVPTDALVLSTVAALEERKGIHKVLNVLPELLRKFPNLIYLIAGDGPEKENLLQQTKTLNLEPHVVFLGAVTDVITVYHATDVFMFLSYGEASPIAFLEAMACGLAIIAAHRKPLEEFGSPTGVQLVDDENLEEVRRVLVDLLSDPTKRVAMGQENRRRAESNFGWEKIASQYMKLFARGK